MADDSQNREQMIQGFMGLAQFTREQAEAFLEHYDYDVASASEAILEQTTSSEVQESQEADDSYTGGRTLDGSRPAPEASSSRHPRQTASQPKTQKQTGIATLESISSRSQPQREDKAGRGNGRDDRKDDGVESFTGGEKSGLAVQDPKKRGENSRQKVNDILAKAEASSRSDPNRAVGPSQSFHFRGTGVTLGGEGTESRVVADPLGPALASREPRQLTLHVWRDGISVDDGKLHSYDDPANEKYLEQIENGEAPTGLMNINPNEPVDVRLLQHETPYPKQRNPFGGDGKRLGAGTSSENDTSSTVPNTAAETNPPRPAQSNVASANTRDVDRSRPIFRIRIELPGGSRPTVEFNDHETVGDVYEYVRARIEDDQTTPWVLATTFPNVDYTDPTAVLKDVKLNNVSVKIKWQKVG